MSIQETLQKIKSPVKHLQTRLQDLFQLVKNKNNLHLIGKALALFLVIGVGAFLVGRISAFSVGDRGIEVVYPPLVATDVPKYEDKPLQKADTKDLLKTASNSQKEPADWAFAASKSGKTYYPKDCKGLARVKPENRVYFKTLQQAETAGLTLSKTCKTPL